MADNTVLELGVSVKDLTGQGLDSAVSRVEGASGKMSKSLGDIGAGAEFSFASLLKIGGAAVGIYSVGEALRSATKDAYDFDKQLARIPLSAAAGAAEIERAKKFVEEMTRDLGVFSKTQVSQGLLAARSSGKNEDEAELIARAAFPASVGAPDQLAGNIRLLGDVLDSYREGVGQAAEAQNDFFVAARESSGDMQELEGAVLRASVALDHYGVSRREATASFAGAKATTQGLTFEGASTASQRILSAITDETDAAHQALVDAGAAISEDTLRSRGWLFELRQINDALKEHPELLARFFGDARTQKGVIGLTEGAGRAGDILAKQRSDIDALVRASEEVLNQSSARLDRSVEGVKSVGGVIGEAALKTLDTLFGEGHRGEVEIPIAPQIIDFDKAIKEALSTGDVDKAIAESSAFEQAGVTAARVFRRGFSQAVADRTSGAPFGFSSLVAGLPIDISHLPKDVLNAGQVANLDPFERLNEVLRGSDDLIVSIDGHLKRVVGVAQDAAGNITKVFEDTGKLAGPLTFGDDNRTPGQVKLDALQREIGKALDGLPPLSLPILLRARILPDSVLEAQAKLEQISKSASTGTFPTDQQKGEAAQAEAAIAQFKAQEAQAGILALSLQARITTGLGRQRAENSLIEAQIEAQISAYRNAGVAVDDLVGILGQVKDFDQAAVTAAGDKQVSDIQTRILQLRAASVEKAQQLAQATGQANLADSLGLDLLNAKDEVTRAANATTISGLREQLKGNDRALAQLDELSRLLNEQAGAERAITEAQRARQKKDDEIQAQRELVSLHNELLSGLDAELAGIDQNIEGRREAAEAAQATGKITIDQLVQELFALDQVNIKQRDLAKLRASEGVQDQILQIERDTATALGDQLENLRQIRELQAKQLDRDLKEKGATPEQRARALVAFDASTEKQKRDALIGFAGQSAASLAESELLNKAAIDGANLSLQEQIDLLTRAKYGADALTTGLAAGFTDALRSLNDFDSGVQAGQALVTGFRDSLVNAFDGIGQKGHNFLKDFAIDELKTIQHTFATLASNQITSALGGALGNAFGIPLANQVGPSRADAGLQVAGSTLLTAGIELQAAAVTLGGSAIASGLGGAFADTAGTSLFGFPGATGGVVYGFAQGGIGRNGRAATDPRDTIPALLRKDEYVLTPEKVQALGGVGYLDSLNGRHGGASVARQRVVDSTPNRVVNVEGHTITVNMGGIQISGGGSDADHEKMLRGIEARVRQGIWSALESGSDRRGVEAIRGVAR